MGYRLDGYRLERANEKISKLEDWSLENVCIEVKRKKNGKNRKAPIRHETQWTGLALMQLKYQKERRENGVWTIFQDIRI